MHSVAGAVAETRALWCPGNIALSNEAPPPSPGRRNVAPDSGVIQRERIVTESVAPAPVARERIAPAAYAVGSRVADASALAPMPQALASTVPVVRSYRYMVINNRLLLVDPTTGIVVAEVND